MPSDIKMRKKRQDYFRLIVYMMAVVAILLLVYFIVTSRTMRASVFVSIFIVANMFITSYKRFIRVPIEIEVLTLGIVICTLEFGIKAGLVVAILGGLLSIFVGFDISPFSFPMLLGYILIAFTAFFLRGMDLVLVGIISSLMNNLFVFTIYHAAFNYNLFKNISFSLSNLAVNTLLFVNIAPFILKLII
jgi:hypothetical protein